jgi:hypothetical protein
MDNFPLRSTGQNKRDKYLVSAVLLNMTAFTLTEIKRSFGEKCCFIHITLVEEGSSETSVRSYKTIWNLIPEDIHLHHSRECII